MPIGEVADEGYISTYEAMHAHQSSAGMAGADKLIVTFEMKPVLNRAKSAEAGRPVYVEKEYVEIRIPGDKINVAHKPVTDFIRAKFRERYERWKAGKQDQLVGTPLKVWPPVSAAQVEELAYFKVVTVEQLASVSDETMSRMGPLTELRQKARDFLEAAKGGAPLTKLREELSSRDAEIASLREQMKAQAADLLELKRRK